MKSLAASSLVLFVCGAWPLLGQEVAPISLARVVAGAPVKQTIRLDKKHKAELLTWRVNDPLSPYSGTTLVWLEVQDDDVRLNVDGEPTFEDITQSALRNDRSVVAIVSGGNWSGRYDSAWKERKPDGLVVSNGIPKSPLKTIDTGGVAVICGDDVDIVPISSFRGYPCRKSSPSALQSNVILVRDGKIDPLGNDSPSNRLSLATAHDRVIIAGAFNSVGHALTLHQFADFLTATAQQRKIRNFNAMNLDGDCAAQLFIPQLNAHFGCAGKNYAVDRIVMRAAK